MMLDPTPGAALDLRRLVKRYDAAHAVNDVSLGIRAGEFVTFLGPSGSGKTTTLNMIAGFADVTSGEILMDGQPIADLPPHKRDIGVVFQHYALFPHMTAAENLAFPLKRRKAPKAQQRERVAAALEMVRLGDYADRYPRELSGGQQQRVALARAIVFNPRVLLMDEPLGALDRKLREWLQLEIKRIHSELGITFVYVTHDQDEALVLSDRIAIFSDGKIEQLGAPEELYERPETLFVADFLGESNVFPGRLSARDGQLTVHGDGYELRAPASRSAPADGHAAAIVVRPERLRLRAEGSGPAPGDNVLRGHVRQVIYLGAARRVELALPGGRAAIVREQAGASAPLQEGDAVDVFWSADDSVVLPDRGGTAPAGLERT